MRLTVLFTADLKALITDQGASFSNSVSAECTHLVTNEKDVEKNSNKCESRLGLGACPNIPSLPPPFWIFQC
jgi:hypothetical protein